MKKFSFQYKNGANPASLKNQTGNNLLPDNTNSDSPQPDPSEQVEDLTSYEETLSRTKFGFFSDK